MASFIAELVEQGVLVCPSCRASEWRLQASSLECLSCCAEWPIRNGVPDFFNRYHPAANPDANRPAPEHHTLVTTIVEALELAGDKATRVRVAEIVHRASTWTCDSEALTAEINDLLDRFAPEPREIPLPPHLPDANLEPRIRFDRHYIPSTLTAGALLSANVRVTNTGEHAWSSHVPGGLVLSGQWIDSARRPIADGAKPGRFPIDVLPGRSISIPLQLEAPQRDGTHTLRVRLAAQDTGKPVGESLDVPVRIAGTHPGLLSRFRRGAIGERKSEKTAEVGPQIASYGEDHTAGVKLIEAALKARTGPGARILEVGSGTHPHLAWLTDYRLVALDISSPLLELGSLYFGQRFISRLAFLCADAFNAPLAPGSFDAVAMFSALHHFPEPEALLERLAAILKPTGFLAVMCEPVGDTLRQPDTIRDLLKGINEQVFSVDEYRRIFQQAGLRADRIRIDGASLKAILSH